MRAIQKVVIVRDSGPVGDPTLARVVFEGDSAEDRGNAWLREIAKTSPKKRKQYTLTHVWITLSDGYHFYIRFDVRHTSLPDSNTDIRRYIRPVFLKNCRPEELRLHPRELDYARKQIDPEIKSIAESALAILDADNRTGDEMSTEKLPFGATVTGASPDQLAFLRKRGEFSLRYCREKGWPTDPTRLTIPQILEIRAQPGWQHPDDVAHT